MTKVSIILRCKNEEAMIEKTLKKIFSQEGDFDLEVVAVDSGSTDRTVGILERFPVKLFRIPAEKFSYGYALNYGIERAQGEIICNLSAHCVPQSDRWLEQLLKPLLEGRAEASYGRQVPFQGVNIWEEFHMETLFPAQGKTPKRMAFSNAHCAFYKSLWRERPFDETIARWEDYLWYRLMKSRGRFIYCPEAEVSHSHPFSLGAYLDMCAKDGASAEWFENQYGISVSDKELGILQKILKVFGNMTSCANFFIRKGYWAGFFQIPAVHLLGHWAYEQSYRKAKNRNKSRSETVRVSEELTEQGVF